MPPVVIYTEDEQGEIQKEEEFEGEFAGRDSDGRLVVIASEWCAKKPFGVPDNL